MNTTLDQFLHAVRTKIPNVQTEVDPGIGPSASCWIDLTKDGKKALIEYRPNSGFGLYTMMAAEEYGTRPREIYRSLKSLLVRLEKLFAPATSDLLSLRDLREMRSVTQEQLARMTGKNQSAISKLESRDDILVTTLVEFVEALGGTVNITVHCDDFDVPLSVPSTPSGALADTADGHRSDEPEGTIKSAATHYSEKDSSTDKANEMFKQLIGRILLEPTSVIRPTVLRPALHAEDPEVRWEFELGPRTGRVYLRTLKSKQKILVDPKLVGDAQTYRVYFVSKASGTVSPWPSEQQIGLQLTTRRSWFDISPHITSNAEPVIVKLAATS